MSFKVFRFDGLEDRPVSFSWRRIGPALILAGFLLSYLGQLNFDSWQRFTYRPLNTTYNVYIEPQPLSPQAARVIGFGADEFVASWYWLSMIQYYGGGDPQGKYRKLAELFNTITELSPKFLAAYRMGLLILPGEGFVDQALDLGAKGKRNIPDSWEIPYYLGLDLHMYRKDYAAAAKEFELAASKPNAPANARYFAAIYYNQADERQTAYQLFQSIYENSQDNFIKERAKKYLDHLTIIFYLQDSINKFRSNYGRYPNSLNELVSKRVIPEIPVSPLGRAFTLDPSTGTISDDKRAN